MRGKTLRETINKTAGRVGVMLAAVAVALIVFELLISVVRPAPGIQPVEIYSDGGYYTLSENRRLIYVPNPGAGEFNAIGHRGPLFPSRRVKGKKRVVFIGDSVVEGLGLKTGDRFTDILSARLGGGYEIINLGVQGYNFEQEIEYFKTRGASFKPDAAVFCITIDDLLASSGELNRFVEKMGDRASDPLYNILYSRKTALQKALLRFNTYRYIYIFAKIHNKDVESHTLEDQSERILTGDETVALADELLEFVRDKNIKLSFIFLPYTTRGSMGEFISWESVTNLRRILKKRNVSVLDLNSIVNSSMSRTEKKKLFLENDNCHFNAEGSEYIAGLIHEKFNLIYRD